MAEDVLLALDQGTSSTKAVLLDTDGRVVATATERVGISYPQPGWVEQDPADILRSVLTAAERCLAQAAGRRVAGIGLSTQRESAMVWDRGSGRPVGPLLGWQDRRSVPYCDAVRASGRADDVRRASGLPVDPMFSAPKLRWLLDAATACPDAIDPGRLSFGTVDSWLVFALTGQHVIEAGNASRTQLLDIGSGAWSADLLDAFGIPESVLPTVVPSVGRPAEVTADGPLRGTVVRAVLGDSHAALFAHGVRRAAGAKATYGTGSSVMRLLRGDESLTDAVTRTVAWADPEPRPAAEGNIRSSGATLTWLADVLGTTPGQLLSRAETADAAGVHLVPAFTGLGAPWWDERAVGLVAGLTFGTGVDQLARAAVESVAHQVDDIICAVTASGDPVAHLLADGGLSRNDVVMQAQADLTGLPVLRARATNLSALGAGLLAGVDVGIWANHGLPELEYDEFRPRLGSDEIEQRRRAWRAAVRRAR